MNPGPLSSRGFSMCYFRIYIKISLVVLILCYLVPETVVAQDTLWTKAYGGYYREYGYSLDFTSDGGYILAGFTESWDAEGADIYLVKTDADGDQTWDSYFGTENTDYARVIFQKDNGDYIIGGYTGQFYSEDCWIIIANETGDTLRTRSYGGSSLDKIFGGYRTNDGGYIFVGYTQSFGLGYFDIYLIRTDENGDSLWTRTYGGEGEDKAYSVEQTSDGGFIIAGYTNSFGSGEYFGYLLKLNSNGDTMWTVVHDDAAGANFFNSIRETADKGFIAAGSILAYYGDFYYEAYYVKFDSLGNKEWTGSYGAIGEYTVIESVRQTVDGGYIMVGQRGFLLDVHPVFILRVDNQGDYLWSRSYGSYSESNLYEVEITPEGDFLAIGHQYGQDMWLMKLQEPSYCCEVDMFPDDDPIVVQPGGSFGYTGSLINPTEFSLTFDVWVGVNYDNQFFETRLFEGNEPLEPGEFFTSHFRQNVPLYAPLGDYRYVAYGGNYPSKCDSVWFDFTVVGAPMADGNSEWSVDELFTNVDEDVSSGLPSTISIDNSPNPFNATTTITYQLPEAGSVNLAIYNLSGQKVATLEDGFRNAGKHSVSWDASNYSSGIYFYKLVVGDRVITKRMTLLK
ncbi:MAG: T9SS type A sorting domain-containing protein [candidate division Zixibacteria bacterium]|nr:T9SS type A sorting domain-containing protein [candidate division Zixibacteria bacterium]